MSLFERTAPFGAKSKRASSAADGGSEGTTTDPEKLVAASYNKLDEIQLSLREFEAKAASMRELEELFELSPTRHTGLVEVRTQLRLLKMVWDMVSLVNGLFASWTATLWADIKTDELLDEARYGMFQTANGDLVFWLEINSRRCNPSRIFHSQRNHVEHSRSTGLSSSTSGDCQGESATGAYTRQSTNESSICLLFSPW